MYLEGTTIVDEHARPIVRDVEWFKGRLIEQRVSLFEIVWGNYLHYFHEVPPHLMDRYLHHRASFLHKKALSLTILEEQMMEEHPFAC